MTDSDIDWQVDLCGFGESVDQRGYDIGLTRAGLPATARRLGDVIAATYRREEL